MRDTDDESRRVPPMVPASNVARLRQRVFQTDHLSLARAAVVAAVSARTLAPSSRCGRLVWAMARWRASSMRPCYASSRLVSDARKATTSSIGTCAPCTVGSCVRMKFSS
jgi:hypothetical protein